MKGIWVLLLAAITVISAAMGDDLAEPEGDTSPLSPSLGCVLRPGFQHLGNISEPYDSWHRFLLHELDHGQPLEDQIEKRREHSGIPLTFSDGSTAGRSEDFAAIQDDFGSDGAITTFVKRVPSPKEGIHPDYVLELDQEENVIGEWRTPYEPTIYGVRGATLFLKQEFDLACTRESGPAAFRPVTTVLAVERNGSFRVVRPPRVESLGRTACQKIEQFFCYSFRDPYSGEIRILARAYPYT